MKKGLFITSAMVLLLVFLVQYTTSGNQKAEAVSQEQIRQNMHRIQIPFIANNGQMDERVTFYANTFGGTVFVTKEGEIVYALPKSANDDNRSLETEVRIQKCRGELHSPDVIHDARQISDLHLPTPKSQPPNPNISLQGIALKETLIGAKVKEIKGEGKSVTKVNYFRGNDQKKWKSNISTYDVVNLGEVYKGIELKLKAYGNNVEKLFYVKPGANPDQIKINLSGIRESKSEVGSQRSEVRNQKSDVIALSLNSEFRNPKLRINEHGELCRLGEACPESTERACPEPVEWACPEPVEWAKRTQQNNITKGTSGLWINEQGLLVAETELGPVTFTKPVAYQEIDGKRVDVAVEYEIYAVPQVVHRNKPVLTSGRNAKNAKESIVGNTESAGNVCPPLAGVRGVERDSPHVIQPTTNPKSKIVNLSSTEIGDPKLEYGFKVASYDKTKELVIDPLLASTYLGGSDYDYGYSIALDTSGNVYVAGDTSSTDFPTTVGVYDTSYNGGDTDVFVLKLDTGLTSLLTSTYLGGSGSDDGYSLALDASGNVYVTGRTYSSDFPTTTEAHNTSYNGDGDVFISKLSNDLANLLASTYIGASDRDEANSLAIDAIGNVYIAGKTNSWDFPTTADAYDNDTSNTKPDVFISKLDNNLTTLLASTYLGGSGSEGSGAVGKGTSLAIGASGNVYVAGSTDSSDFPITTGAYDTYSASGEVFISKLNSNLTSLLASTYLGGSGYEYAWSLAIDTNENVYVTGYTTSSSFPTTISAYNTSFNGYSDAYVAKLDSNLTSLLASTYLGGSSSDYGESLAIDINGNVYVVGWTISSDFPITLGAYETFKSSSYDIFISKMDSNLTSLLASTYLGGSRSDYCKSLVIDASGNVYATGYTYSSDFPTSTGVYDTTGYASSDYCDVFISKLDSDLSSDTAMPIVTTDSATNITLNAATLNGTVNANDLSTTAWFEYGLYSGLYDYSTSTKTISGSTDQAVSIDIYNLYTGTKYYYRIVAENEIGTTYGDEMSFTTLSDTTKPSGSISINNGNSYTNSANVTIKLSASDDVGITGYYISTNSSTPSSSSSGWTSISFTTNYSASISYTLDGGDGSKTIYVWYEDDADNISDTYSDSIILDTTPPEVNITSPDSNDTYSTNISVVSVWGNASDATSGISTVKWENNKGGSGTASGTTSWTISNIGLLVDAENIITVTATDNAGNSASDSITVTYSELTAEPTTISTATATPTPKATPTELGAIFGSVVDTDGKPVANATVFTDKGGYSVKTGSNGIYQLNDVAEGSYLLSALAEGYGSVSQTVTVKAGETTKADFTLLRAITPPTPVPPVSPSFNPAPSTTPTPSTLTGKIFGYVMDEIDNPVKKAKVRCKGKNTNVKENATTNKQGYFEFNNLSADSYKITAKKKGFNKSKYNVNLEEGEENEIEIVLEEK